MTSLYSTPDPSAKQTFPSEDLRCEVSRSAALLPAAAAPGPPRGRFLGAATLRLRLRRFPHPTPAEPHPALGELRRLLRLPVPILGLHAVAGVDKSSLLEDGLVPALRGAGHPVALVRDPLEPALAERLIGDLLICPRGGTALRPGSFVDLLMVAQRLSRKPAVLVIDQLDPLLRRGGSAARCLLGELLLASIREASLRREHRGTPFRWLLAYRRDVHPAVKVWLARLDQELLSPRFSHFTPWETLGSPVV